MPTASPYPVRPQRHRQPPIRFGYYTSGSPGDFVDPNVGMIHAQPPWMSPCWTLQIQHPIVQQPHSSITPGKTPFLHRTHLTQWYHHFTPPYHHRPLVGTQFIDSKGN